LPFTDAAAIPLVFLTAWQMVVLKARVEPGQTVLVHSAGSGVSSAAIQIAKLFGARVITTTGTDAKAAKARALGADVVIDRSSQDFVAEVKKLTSGRGADVVIEHVGGDVMTASVRATAKGGRIVTCGASAGHSPEIDLRHVFFRQIEILGSTMGPKASLFTILGHVGSGKLRPVVDRVLPLWDAAQGHRVLESREVFGKVVLEVD
jgi:NADPH:quinone reductase-like Zn-dependent oxidoreductase